MRRQKIEDSLPFRSAQVEVRHRVCEQNVSKVWKVRAENRVWMEESGIGAIKLEMKQWWGEDYRGVFGGNPMSLCGYCLRFRMWKTKKQQNEVPEEGEK